MLPYGKQQITDADIEAVTAALRTDWLTTGPKVDEFEADLAAVAGVPCVSVINGTAALHTAYAAAGIGAGDEVITTPMTFVATASTAAMLGATVVFADVEEDTANLDPAAVEALVSSRTRAVTAVDYAGHPAEYDELRKVADTVGATLLADAAHAIGSTYRGRPVGTLADLTTFSFFPTKNLTTAEGGAVASPDPELVRRARTFRTVGLVRDRSRMRHPDEGGWHQEVHEFGLNRSALSARYDELLADVPGLRLPTRRAWVDPMRHLYPVRILGGRRREVFERMREAGIGVQVNYIPAYWHPVFEDLGYRRGMCPVAEAFYAEQLSLPLFVDLTDAEQDRVVEALRDILGG
jgi:dTDP-4-amino-4,6-dideoxygalactose transaminase